MPSRVEPVARVFEELSGRYDAWYETASGRALFALELASLRPLLEGSVRPQLEVGVGSGRFAAALGLDVGIDLAAAPLRLARPRGLAVVRGAGTQLPFRAGTFGAVVLVVTLCFATDPAGLLAEAHRVLRPGGRLVAGVVPLDSPWGRAYAAEGRAGHPFYRHARFLTVAEFRSQLLSAGFTVVDGRSTLLQAPGREPAEEPVRRGIAPGAGFVALSAVGAPPAGSR